MFKQKYKGALLPYEQKFRLRLFQIGVVAVVRHFQFRTSVRVRPVAATQIMYPTQEGLEVKGR